MPAALVREDGREEDVFSLIGPKRYDAPWKDIESQGWIAPAECVEVRTTLSDEERLTYATAETRERYRLAACSRGKLEVVDTLLAKHAGQQTLIIGAYVDQLEEIAEHLGADLITGQTPGTTVLTGTIYVGGKAIKAEVPLSEMFGYATSLRSQTQGRATFTMEFDHYEPAPQNIADTVIKKG